MRGHFERLTPPPEAAAPVAPPDPALPLPGTPPPGEAPQPPIVERLRSLRHNIRNVRNHTVDTLVRGQLLTVVNMLSFIIEDAEKEEETRNPPPHIEANPAAIVVQIPYDQIDAEDLRGTRGEEH